MNKQRQPELEDSEQQEPLSQSKDLATQLDKATSKMSSGYNETQQPTIPTDETRLRVLVVDDNSIFLESLLKPAQDLNLEITTLQPDHVNATRTLILDAFHNQQAFDCVLLDYAYQQKDFNGLAILNTLRPKIKSIRAQDYDDNVIKLHYLPVAIVTRGGSEEQNVDRFDPDKALGAGADKVYSEKGFGLGSTDNAQQDKPYLTAQPLLTYLRSVGFNEMRFRAWARMWQDLRDQLEDQIKLQLDKNQWLKDETIERALVAVWNTLAQLIMQAGYASHLSMRTLHYCEQNKIWELRKVGSTEMQNCPENIAWDAIPLLKKCLTENHQLIHSKEKLLLEKCLTENHQLIHSKEKLLKADLINNRDENRPEILTFLSLIDRSAMAAPLDSKISSVGTFLMTREPDQPPFSEEDKTQLRITVERLGLFLRELNMRKRHHDRQIALVELGKKLMDEDSEDNIVAKAVEVLHEHLHKTRSAFRPNPEDNPAGNGRVSIRLIEPGTGRLMRPDHTSPLLKEDIPRWALGFDTKDNSPSMIKTDSDPRYIDVIKKGEPLFFAQPTKRDIEGRRQDKTHSKMLAPIMAGPVVVGTVNVEHKDKHFYGQEENASADYSLLQAVALEVGQALRALRARRMLRKLLQLHKSTGEQEQQQVIDALMGILYHYTGCAVGIWLEPEAENWKISGVWECPQGYQEKIAPDRFRNDHKKKSQRLEEWQKHIEGNFEQTLICTVINDDTKKDSSVTYKEDGFLNDEKMGIKTLSQAVLILRDPDSKETLGIFSFLFNQKPGLDKIRQGPLLKEAGDFAASYLSIRKKNVDFLQNSQIMEQQVGLGFAYQQLRHSLKLQLGGLNGNLDRLLADIEDNAPHPDVYIQNIKGFLSTISYDIELSKTMMNPPNLQPVNIQSAWESVRAKFTELPDIEGIDFDSMTESVWVRADPEIVEMVFQNLIDNAVEAMAAQAPPCKLSCLLLQSGEPSFVTIAIRDTGPGLQPEVAESLFENIGLSTKATGTGFGTYFSAYMLRRSEADIRYDRNYRNGAQFILKFPANKPES